MLLEFSRGGSVVLSKKYLFVASFEETLIGKILLS